ncbi:unnamed protein product [Arabis nemorensis]|uniref:NYN domain-containing protein n=1 Tax=Arabis nemorensis TaxID=586526 RepID=A0A565BMM3_9BRAS|nr:unnamed protein product [Arabis nemorensis]
MSYREKQSLHEEHERRRDKKRARSCDPILTGTKVPDCCVPLRSPRPFTAVFWDLEDCSIFDKDSTLLIYQNINSNLASKGYRGKMSIYAYAEKNKLSDKLMSDLPDAGITLPPEDNPVHHHGPQRANLIVISNNIREETQSWDSLCAMKGRGYHVLLVNRDGKLPSRSLRTATTKWLFKKPRECSDRRRSRKRDESDKSHRLSRRRK